MNPGCEECGVLRPLMFPMKPGNDGKAYRLCSFCFRYELPPEKRGRR